jgi:hypothetical protein
MEEAKTQVNDCDRLLGCPSIMSRQSLVMIIRLRFFIPVSPSSSKNVLQYQAGSGLDV